MNEEGSEKVFTASGTYRGHLWRRYSIAVNQVMVATVTLSKWWGTKRNPWFSSFLVNSNPLKFVLLHIGHCTMIIIYISLTWLLCSKRYAWMGLCLSDRTHHFWLSLIPRIPMPVSSFGCIIVLFSTIVVLFVLLWIWYSSSLKKKGI